VSNRTGEAPNDWSRNPFPARATRYEPCQSDACLSSGETKLDLERDPSLLEVLAGPKTSRQFALLLDISQTGALIALDRVPSAREGVWLGLEGEANTDWTPAEVVGVTTTPRGPHLVRLAFRSPCPFETLRAVICG